MSTFKDAIGSDIKSVFLSTDEFADTCHVIYEEFSGDIPVVLDESVQDERPENSRVDDHIQGIFRVTTMFYAAQSDMGLVPKKGRRIWIGDDEFEIITSACDMGVIALGLRRYDE